MIPVAQIITVAFIAFLSMKFFSITGDSDSGSILQSFLSALAVLAITIIATSFILSRILRRVLK